MTSATSTPTRAKRISRSVWALSLVPLILLGAVLAYIVVTGGGLRELTGPPLEKVTIQRITLPRPGIIRLTVINDGPQAVTIPQVMVDEAYWEFAAEPGTKIARLGRATFTIPYPWVSEETHRVTLITSLGQRVRARKVKWATIHNSTVVSSVAPRGFPSRYREDRKWAVRAGVEALYPRFKGVEEDVIDAVAVGHAWLTRERAVAVVGGPGGYPPR